LLGGGVLYGELAELVDCLGSGELSLHVSVFLILGKGLLEIGDVVEKLLHEGGDIGLSSIFGSGILDWVGEFFLLLFGQGHSWDEFFLIDSLFDVEFDIKSSVEVD